ncbi:MAG: galactokinase [Bryobacteraceae bacterium]
MAITPDQIVARFKDRFQTDSPPTIYRAPGRVNLMGEHTDYNLGYVFPIALNMACYTAIAPSHSHLLVHSHDFESDFEIAIEDIPRSKPRGDWSDYVLGVAQQLLAQNVPLTGADVYVWTTVPLGAGLSSSAALEISTAFALLGSQPMDPLEIATVAQRAESQFVGMPCGIMDQYTSVFGRAGEAVQIDCRSLEHEYVKLPGNLRIVAVNSMVKHQLGTSAYRERVAECHAAVEAIRAFEPHVESLRDVPVPMFERLQDSIPTTPRRRARHIISDSQRVLDLAAAARVANLDEMGRLFIASHRSMQYDYEISCDEVDFLVDTAIKIPGVYGARMTGGGFGGCTVNLVQPEAVNAFQDQIAAAYQERYSILPAFYDCVPAAGAGRVE